MDKNKARVKKWLKVFQYLAGYLVAAWTFLQFVEWILDRYNISPYWVDIFLWFFVGIIPSLLIYLYHQDRINQRILKLREKIIFPLNLVLVFIGLYFGFGTSDLGATTKEVSYLDAMGELNETTVTKEEFRTQLPIFNFTNLTDDEELNWMGEGIAELLFYDLLQDKNITPDQNWAENTTDKVMESSFISDIYVDGEFEKKDGKFSITSSIRSSKNGAVINSKTFEGDDFLDLVDEISHFIKISVDIPETNKLQYIDLGIKEFVSTSVPAIKNFVRGNYEEATALDSTFALAYLRSSRRDITYSKGKIDEQALAEKAYRYRERLPYDMQMEAMANRYLAYDKFDEAKELVEMQLEISPQNRFLNNLLYGIHGETKDIEAYFDTAQKRFEASKSMYNIENMADASLVVGEYDRYIQMVDFYSKLNPRNNFIFPYKLVPELLKKDAEAAKETLKKTKLLHPGQDNINAAFDAAVTFLEKEETVDLNYFEGIYRSQLSEALVKFWIVEDRLLYHYSNQTIETTMPTGKTSLVVGMPNGFTGEYEFYSDKNGIAYGAKVTENYYNGGTNVYWIWKLDDSIRKAEEHLLNEDYDKAEVAYQEAITKNPNHFYLKNTLQHIQYVKSIDSLDLQKQFNDVVGLYSKEGVENTRKLFVKDGKLMYKREGIPSKQLLPISRNRYMNLNSLRLHFEFDYEDDEAVASYSLLYDAETDKWENYGPELNYLYKEKK
ncbi:tetratricopeptide repeat protein [Croceivirga thetidis]|uniref:Tetratricopeptide repeat protein n=1 Tax=Croceivirga thetidis TaxID=2721623 RepID=A0ABX1GU59_9FLAO|nr:hypothetical protein [Croceivirga thetidis]NKI32460.1 hypothetical protein [Croceivirga thetidis]